MFDPHRIVKRVPGSPCLMAAFVAAIGGVKIIFRDSAIGAEASGKALGDYSSQGR